VYKFSLPNVKGLRSSGIKPLGNDADFAYLLTCG